MLRFLFCSLYFIPQSHLKIQKFHPPGFDGPAHGASLKHMPYRSALRFSAEWENLRRKEHTPFPEASSNQSVSFPVSEPPGKSRKSFFSWR